MLLRGTRKYIFNPVIGFLPCILYVSLHIFSDFGELQALAISLIVAIVGEFIIRKIYKSRMFSITFYISMLSFIVTFIYWLFTHNLAHTLYTYIIFCEIIVICCLVGLRTSKVFISTFFFREKGVIEKAWMNEFFHIAYIIQYSLSAHLFFLLTYRNFTEIGPQYRFPDIFTFAVLPMIILTVIGIYHLVRTSNLITRLKSEEWLPIVTEKGEVTGKIAKSISLKMKNKFLHPIVRVALVCNGKVFLQERNAKDILNPLKLDYPFEKYMLFDHEINLAARNSIRQMLGYETNIPIKFLLKYPFENENTKRLILLFVTTIEDETLIKRENKIKGKFWTIKQMEEAFVDEIFSEPFEFEFEYLKNTILAPSNDPLKRVKTS